MALLQNHQPKEDDITAVLGRFKAWNTGLDAHREPQSEVFSGLQEISYEEALGDRGTRRMLPRLNSTTPTTLQTASHSTLQAVTSAAAHATTMTAAQAMTPSAAPAALHAAAQATVQATSQSTATATPQAKTPPLPDPERDSAAFSHDGQLQAMQSKAFERSAQDSPAFAGAVAAPSSSVVRPPKVASRAFVTTPERMGAQQTMAPAPNKITARPAAGKAGTARATTTASSARRVSSIAGKRAPAASPRTTPRSTRTTVNAQLAASARPAPTFKAVLEEDFAQHRRQTSPPASNPSPRRAAGKASMVPWVQARSISLKLNVSAGEHATIKAGAGEAGLPLAVYMRQCTLDVEVLRKLLKQTIADIRTYEASPSQPLLAAPLPAPPIKPARPGLFKRLKDAWIDKDKELSI